MGIDYEDWQRSDSRSQAMTQIEVGWVKFPTGLAQAFQVGLGKVLKPENKGDFNLLTEEGQTMQVACFLDQSELTLTSINQFKSHRIDHRGKLRLYEPYDPLYETFFDGQGRAKNLVLWIGDIKLSVCRVTEIRIEANQNGCHQTVSIVWTRTWPPMGSTGKIIAEVVE